MGCLPSPAPVGSVQGRLGVGGRAFPDNLSSEKADSCVFGFASCVRPPPELASVASCWTCCSASFTRLICLKLQHPGHQGKEGFDQAWKRRTPAGRHTARRPPVKLVEAL